MNTANWMNRLPGLNRRFSDRRWWDVASLAETLEYLNAYATAVAAPVRENTRVRSVEQRPDGTWHVVADNHDVSTPVVAICTGAMSRPRIPLASERLPQHVHQLHSSEYRRPAQIHTRRVLVVGSGNSGVQICHELACVGFDEVYLSVSGNRVLPWHIWGIPIAVVTRAIRIFDTRRTSFLGKRLAAGRARGDIAMAPGPAELRQQYGVRLVGRVRDASAGKAVECDDGSRVSTDDLTIVWCTGFADRYEWIRPSSRTAAFYDDGEPKHQRGEVPGAPGLYFVGLRFQYTLSSHLLYGVGRDARHVSGRIRRYLAEIRAGSRANVARAIAE